MSEAAGQGREAGEGGCGVSKVKNLIDAMRKVGIPDEKGVELLIAFLELEEGDDALERREKSARKRQARYRERRGLTEAEWAALRAEIIERDGEVCGYCAKPAKPPFVDHMVPIIKGGSNDPENLIVACGPCNGGKAGKTYSEWRQKL